MALFAAASGFSQDPQIQKELQEVQKTISNAKEKKRGDQDFLLSFLMIQKKDLEIGESLGKGSFGEVFEATLRKKTPVAVKVLLEGELKDVESEIGILSKVNFDGSGKYVPKFYGISIIKGKPALILELADSKLKPSMIPRFQGLWTRFRFSSK